MRDTIEAMVGTLSRSVSEIMDGSTGDARDQLLTKSYTEFADALEAEFNQAADAAINDAVDEELGKVAADAADAGIDLENMVATVQEPLFKGLGSVGRVANLVDQLNREVDAIKQGDEEDGDASSEVVSDLLDHMVAMGDLALRASVNEHVELSDEDEELEDGVHHVLVPMASGDGHMVVKTALPEDLAKLASDPDVILSSVVDLGAGLLIDSGVPEEALAKAFAVADGEPLSKAFPPPKKKMPDGSSASGDGTDPGAATDADPNDPNAGGGGDPGADGQGDDDPLTVLGRILAAAMIQLSHIQDMVNGQPGDDPNADPNAAPAGGAPSGAPMQQAAPEGDLQKVNTPETEALQKQIAEMSAKLEKLARQPQPAKGVLVPGLASLEKSTESGGRDPGDDPLEKEAAAIDRMPEGEKRDEARTVLLTKIALSGPGVPLNGPPRAVEPIGALGAVAT